MYTVIVPTYEVYKRRNITKCLFGLIVQERKALVHLNSLVIWSTFCYGLASLKTGHYPGNSNTLN